MQYYFMKKLDDDFEKAIDNPSLSEIASEVRGRLEKVVNNL